MNLSGLATFDYVPSQSGQLIYSKTEARPIRSATLEVVDKGGQLLARTTTDDQGRYSVSLAADQIVRLRVLAQMNANGAPISVTDNTRADALYAVESPAFASNTGTAHVHAASGWTGSAYVEARAAAPFAILDTVYRAQRKLLAVDPAARLKPLGLHWSTANNPSAGDPATGEITSTRFRSSDGKGHIYILGKAGVDTDEYDESVIAHEWGHYHQWAFSRDDSPGGSHGGEPLEMTVAFSEGWGDALSAIVTERRDYSDAGGPGQANGFSYLLDGLPPSRPGWFREESIAKIVYQLSLQAGFAPIHQAMKSLANTPAFTSIFAFSDAVRRNNAGTGDTLDQLLSAHSIVTSKDSGDPFGTNETNDGRLGIYDVPPYVQAMPIYQRLTLDVASWVCSFNVAALSNMDKSLGIPNKLGNHRFMRFDALSAGRYRVTVRGMTRGDGTQAHPFLSVLQGGTRNWYGSPQPAFYGNLNLPDGPTVMSVEDKDVTDGKVPSGCIEVTITKAPVN
ncbi:hypothetical protein [Ramlibacter sp.]|uniref:hypothetical protein n=1 Tax=Ramlibacter sp. TaxID=1917967 RepID=UPI0026185DAD|nr:hypothetical protein [Ramlibacter sp.]